MTEHVHAYRRVTTGPHKDMFVCIYKGCEDRRPEIRWAWSA